MKRKEMLWTAAAVVICAVTAQLVIAAMNGGASRREAGRSPEARREAIETFIKADKGTAPLVAVMERSYPEQWDAMLDAIAEAQVQGVDRDVALARQFANQSRQMSLDIAEAAQAPDASLEAIAADRVALGRTLSAQPDVCARYVASGGIVHPQDASALPKSARLAAMQLYADQLAAIAEARRTPVTRTRPSARDAAVMRQTLARIEGDTRASEIAAGAAAAGTAEARCAAGLAVLEAYVAAPADVRGRYMAVGLEAWGRRARAEVARQAG